MGGIHLASRSTNHYNYIGVKSDLTLPTNVSADSSKGIKPEFFFGFYRDSYGIDIGVVYESNAFRLFYWTSASVPPPGGSRGSVNDPAIGASVGEKITLKAYLNGSKITCEAIRSNGQTTTLHCPLSDGAITAYRKGASINRELNIAANKPQSGAFANPCNVYFYNAVFSNGFCTTVGNQRILLNEEYLSDGKMMSYISRNKDVDNYVNKSILKVCDNDIGGVEASNNCSYERASCDFNHI